MIERRGGKKGHSLAYRFEQLMEFGDTSDKDAPPPPPKNRDLLKTACRLFQCSKGWKAMAT